MLASFCMTILAAASNAPPAMASFFPKLAGLTLVDGPTAYGPDTLYEYIDGGADAFLMYDFEELAAATYRNEAKDEVTVDIYRHRDAVRAFGMYLQERPNGSTPLKIGIEGYQGDQHLELVAGPYYAKLSGKTTLLMEVAVRIAPLLPGTRESPAVFKAFPTTGRLARAEKLSTRDFLGQAFLHDGFAVPYELDGVRFRLFVIEGRHDADALAMVRRYLALAGVAGEPKAEGSATLKDPLNGEVELAWRGRWIWGAVDSASGKRKALMAELGRGLK